MDRTRNGEYIQKKVNVSQQAPHLIFNRHPSSLVPVIEVCSNGEGNLHMDHTRHCEGIANLAAVQIDRDKEKESSMRPHSDCFAVRA